jgi:hypothetical protein
MPARLGLQENGGQADQTLSRSRRGFSTKIHVTVDELSHLLRMSLTAVQRHDIIQAAGMMVGLNSDDAPLANVLIWL